MPTYYEDGADAPEAGLKAKSSGISLVVVLLVVVIAVAVVASGMSVAKNNEIVLLVASWVGGLIMAVLPLAENANLNLNSKLQIFFTVLLMGAMAVSAIFYAATGGTDTDITLIASSWVGGASMGVLLMRYVAGGGK